MCVKVARLAVQSNFFPLYEVESGVKYTLNYQGNTPVKDYMKVQGRFKHLADEDYSRIQAMVDEDWDLLNRKVGLSQG